MAINVGKMVSELRRMTVTELRRKHAEVFGEPTRSHHKDYLVRQIAWRVQANAEGGLSERARRRALEIADDADLRTRAPGPAQLPSAANPSPSDPKMKARLEARDKIAAARRKGKWAGGHPILGYDVDPRNFRLVVNEEEAERVREIFALYLEHEALIPAVKAIDERGWVNKRWTTRKGLERGGKPFDKNSLFKLLTNVAYIGKVRYKSEVHEGEHDAIVDAEVWRRVQQLLARNGRTGGAAVRNKHGALLKDLLRCAPCGCSMGHTYSTKNGAVQYRYYVCLNAQKRGWHTCPSKSVPAGEIERLVVEQIRAIGQNPELLSAEMFVDLRDAKAHAARWKNDSNHRRPHSSLGYQTPAAFAVSLSRPPVGAAPRPPADSANPCSPVPTLITAGT